MNKALLIAYGSIILLAASNARGQSSERAAELLNRSNQSVLEKDFESASKSALEALGLLEQLEDSTGMAEALYTLGRVSALVGNFKNAYNYTQQGLSLLGTIENDPLEFKTLSILVWSAFELEIGITEILDWEKKQVRLAENLRDSSYIANVYNNYGYDVTVMGTVPLDEAIQLVKVANDFYAHEEGNQGRWYTLMNLTWQYRMKNQLDSSTYFGKLSVAQAEADQDRHAIIEACTNLGETLLESNELSQAREYYGRAKEMAEADNDRDRYVFDVYYARYLWATDRKNESIGRLISAVSFLETSEIFYEMLARALLSMYLVNINRTNEADQHLDRFISPRNDYYSLEAKVYGAIAYYLRSKENASQSLEQLKLQSAEIGAELLIERIEKIEKL